MLLKLHYYICMAASLGREFAESSDLIRLKLEDASDDLIKENLFNLNPTSAQEGLRKKKLGGERSEA